jgi:ferric-dicitrate binding protein FerR (iron transport regulator)
MFTKSRIPIVLAGIFGCVLLLSPAVQPGGEQQIGRVLYSSHATLGGVPIPQAETILSGDVLTTSEKGSALVEFKSGTKVKIMGNSSVRFLRDGQRVQAQLLSGTILPESTRKSALVVTTPWYRFEPSQDGPSQYLVRLVKDQQTVAAAMKGQVLVKANDSDYSYVLSEGRYAAIPVSASGVPARISPEGPNSGQSPRKKKPNGNLPWHIGSLSKDDSIYLIVAIAAGTAAAITIPLATGGPASPSSPSQ